MVQAVQKVNGLSSITLDVDIRGGEPPDALAVLLNAATREPFEPFTLHLRCVSPSEGLSLSSWEGYDIISKERHLLYTCKLLQTQWDKIRQESIVPGVSAVRLHVFTQY